MSISENLKSVYSKIDQYKTCDTVTLVAVSKYSEYVDIEKAYEAGQNHFGENRIDSLAPKALKAKELGHEINWHFIGNIQSNKIKDIAAIEGLYAIHSIDSVKHLKKFYECIKTPVKFFIQFNTSDEAEKGGLNSLDEFKEFANVIAENKDSPFEFAGLMTMGKLRTDDLEGEARACFKKLANIRDDLNSELLLSMGMSADYHIALQEGANFIRVGSSIFK